MIKEIHIPLHTTPWLNWRRDHIGGSDISAVCAGYNMGLAEISWTAPLKYYLTMIGEGVQPFMGNVPSNMGQYFEKPIVQLYRFYDKAIPPEPDSSIPLMQMFDNLKQNKIQNRVVCRHNYIYNTKYPHLSGSPDGFVYTNQGRGILEIKNMTSMEQNRYKNRINPAHVLQCQHNMLCSGAKFCDLIRLTDGTWLDILTLTPNQEQQDFIIKCAGDFWSRVLEAKKIKKEYDIDTYYDVNDDFFTDRQKEGVGLLQSIEPDFVGTDVELKWLREFIKPPVEELERDIGKDDIPYLEQMKDANINLKYWQKQANKAQEELISNMKGYQVSTSQNGYYSYKLTAKGTPRFYIQPKLLEAH